MQKVIVIYYDGNEHKAKECETSTPDSSMPLQFGLDESFDIIAVITNPNALNGVYIDEILVLGEAE